MKRKFSIILFLLVITTALANAQSKIEVSSTEVITLLQKNKKIIVLDVRTPEEYKQGHINGAINIDIKQSDAYDKIDKLDHHAIYIVHCRTSHRSTTAVNYMLEKGFKNIYQMMDGYNGWILNNLPVSK